MLYNCYKPTLFASGHQWNALSVFSVHTLATDVRQLLMHMQLFYVLNMKLANHRHAQTDIGVVIFQIDQQL